VTSLICNHDDVEPAEHYRPLLVYVAKRPSSSMLDLTCMVSKPQYHNTNIIFTLCCKCYRLWYVKL